jgi:hypothetical protein
MASREPAAKQDGPMSSVVDAQLVLPKSGPAGDSEETRQRNQGINA